MIRHSTFILLPLSFLLLLSLAAPAGMAQRDISRDRYLPPETLLGSATQPEENHGPILIPSRDGMMNPLRVTAPPGLRPRFELLQNN